MVERRRWSRGSSQVIVLRRFLATLSVAVTEGRATSRCLSQCLPWPCFVSSLCARWKGLLRTIALAVEARVPERGRAEA